ATPITRVSAVHAGRAAAAAIPPLGDLAALLTAADRHPDAPLRAADDLRRRELGVLAELLLRRVHAHRLGLGLDLCDLLDLPVLQRLGQPRLRPLTRLHDELARVSGPLDRLRADGQRQVGRHDPALPAAGDG